MFVRYSGIALQFVVTIGLLVWLGLWLDGKTQIVFPIFTILFLFLGTGVSFYLLFRQINKNE